MNSRISLALFLSAAYWYQTEPHAPFPKLPSPEEIVAGAPK
jgi:hypothetical protein